MDENSVFQKALKITLSFEGGYSNDKADPGGATNKGITQEVYDKYRLERKLNIHSVKEISQSEMEQIYLNKYWVPGSCALLHPPIGVFHFDTCAHLGLNQAGKLLQRAIGIQEKNVDGIIGEHSLAVAEIIPSSVTIIKYVNLRIDFYKKIISQNPILAKFKNGWINRVEQLEEEVWKI